MGSWGSRNDNARAFNPPQPPQACGGATPLSSEPTASAMNSAVATAPLLLPTRVRRLRYPMLALVDSLVWVLALWLVVDTQFGLDPTHGDPQATSIVALTVINVHLLSGAAAGMYTGRRSFAPLAEAPLLMVTAALGIAGVFFVSGLLAGEPLIASDALIAAGVAAVMANLGARYLGRFVFRAGNRAALFVAAYLAPSKVASTGVPVGAGYLVTKRLLDFSGALIGLVLLTPLFLLVALLIKLDDAGPVFFRQVRVGHFGRPFRMVKLRTMAVDSDEAIHRQHVALVAAGPGMLRIGDDPRITRIGQYLRRWSLDETPNLFNVLSGQMSLVGPRPLVPYEVDHLPTEALPRFQAKQGITGLAQISGRLRLTPEDRAALDVAYARNRSIWLDLKVLANTFPAVFRTRG